MSDLYRCGNCGDEFKPEAIYYGGANLCPACLEKKHEAIMDAKRSFDGMSRPDREACGGFGEAVANALPEPSVEYHCVTCDSVVSERGSFCSSCNSRREALSREHDLMAEEAKEEFERKLRNL